MKLPTFILITLLTKADLLEQRWSWSWTCIDDSCIRSNYPSLEKDIPINNHESVCKLTCARNGLFWPMPTGKVSVSGSVVNIHPDMITFNLEDVTNGKNFKRSVPSIMHKMVDVFMRDLKTLCYNKVKDQDVNELIIKISTSTDDITLNWETDESYKLNVAVIEPENQLVAEIEATSVFGARHGLQSLSQAIVSYSINKICYLAMPDNVVVVDNPIYRHRGLLIDTSRHYLPVSTIKRMLNGMAHSKLNTLHWHATDSHSFPLQLPENNPLSRFGAYSMDEIYTVNDIANITYYAKTRGVRIIMEIDAPAHAGFGWQFKSALQTDNVVCLNYKPFRSFCVQPPCGQLNPAEPSVYQILSDIYADLYSLFKDTDTFHMGGDEVYIPCWRSSERIKDYLQKKGRGTLDEDFLYLWSEFQNKSLQILDELIPNHKISPILWSSHLTDPKHIEQYLSNTRYVIETWVESKDTLPQDLLQKGYRIIIATKDAWYLDHGFWGRTQYHQWNVVYQNRLPNDTDLVIGGEVAMWGEYADDNVIDGKIWPRAAAAAERLWTNPNTDALEAEERLLFLRQRLIKMGIRADSIASQFCEQSLQKCA